MDIKGEIDSDAVIVRDSNTTSTSVDRSSRQRVNKETAALNDTLDQMGLMDVFRAAKCTFFSSAQGTFSRIDLMFGTKTSLNKF